MNANKDMTEEEFESILVNKLEKTFNDGYKEAIMDFLNFLQEKINKLEEQENEI